LWLFLLNGAGLLLSTASSGFFQKVEYNIRYPLRAVQGKTFTNSKNKIGFKRQGIIVNSEKFPDDSFNSIAFYRTFEFAVNTNSKSAFIAVRREKEQVEIIAP
jgi:hypothetical protein